MTNSKSINNEEELCIKKKGSVGFVVVSAAAVLCMIKRAFQDNSSNKHTTKPGKK